MLTTGTHDDDDDVAWKPADFTIDDIDNNCEGKEGDTPNDAGATVLHLPTLPALPAPATFQFGIPQSALLAPVLPSPKKKRKTQCEFTIHQKLDILQELEGPDPPRVPDLAAKHNTSRGSIYGWKNDRRRLMRLGKREGKGGCKRVAHKRKGYNEEFTHEEKLAVLRELKLEDAPSVRSLAERVGADHRSIYRWRKDEERLVKLVEMEGKGGCKRVGGDPLLRVKEGLKFFHAVYYETHNDGSNIDVEEGEVKQPPNVQVDISGNPLEGSDSERKDEQLPESLPQPPKQPPLTGTMIAKKALQIRDEMLLQHELNPFLSEEEVKGMREFTACGSWGRKFVIKMGWKDHKFSYNDAPAVDGDDAGGGDGGTMTIDAVIDRRSSAPKGGDCTKSFKVAELKREINVLLRKLEKSESKGKKLQKENTRLKKQNARLTKSCSSKALRNDPNSSDAVNMDVFPVSQPTLSGKEVEGKKRKVSKKTGLKGGRKEFTNQEKLQILNEIQMQVSTQADICRKYGMARTTLHYWKKKRDQLEKEVMEDGRGNKKKMNINDPLKRIKDGLRAFYEINNARPKALKLPITLNLLMTKAVQIKEKLQEEHANSPILSDKEVEIYMKFKASESWASKFARESGWKSKALHGKADSVDIDHPGTGSAIEKIQENILEYNPHNVYNMDGTLGSGFHSRGWIDNI